MEFKRKFSKPESAEDMEAIADANQAALEQEIMMETEEEKELEETVF